MNKHLFTLIQTLVFIQQIISSQAIIQDDPSSSEVDLNNTHTPDCNVSQTVFAILDKLIDVHFRIRMFQDLSTTDLNPCKTLMYNILCGVIDLQEIITKRNTSQLSSSEFRILEFKYLLRTQDLQVQIETLYNIAKPDVKCRISELEIKLKILQEQAKEAITTLRCQQKKQLINKYISQIDEFVMDEDAQKCGVLDHDQQTKLIQVASKHVSSDIIQKWSNNFISGNCERISNLSDLDQLIRNVYDDDPFGTTLKFINGLHNLDEKSIAFTYLFNAMKEKSIDSPDIFRLAYHVKAYMSGEFGDYHSQPTEVISRFDALKSSFPPSIKAILWDTVSIKNRLHNEYLFAATEYPFDDDWRRIFTWRQKGTIVANREWKLDTINEGSSFRIKSVQHQEYMYTTERDSSDTKRRSVFTWRHENGSDENGEWLLEPIEGATAFKLKSLDLNEYFYADVDDWSYDSDRRNVFTCKHGAESAPFGEIWEIIAF